jgi:predicted transcriptional regulator
MVTQSSKAKRIKPKEQLQRRSSTQAQERSPQAHHSAANDPYGGILSLQQAAGNQAVSRLLQQQVSSQTASQPIQAKLQVGQPGDIWEQEADHIAEAIVQPKTASFAPKINSISPTVQRDYLGKRLMQRVAYATVRYKRFIKDAEKYGLPVKLLKAVFASRIIIAEPDLEDNYYSPVLNELHFKKETIDSVKNFAPVQPSGRSSAAQAIYHESTHAIFDILENDPKYKQFIAEGNQHYKDAPTTEGTITTDPPRVFQEAVASYVGHRVAAWWEAFENMSINLAHGKTDSTTFERIRKEYNSAMAEMQFGYSEEGGFLGFGKHQVETSRSITPEMKQFLDRELLEDKIPDQFDAVVGFQKLLADAQIVLELTSQKPQQIMPKLWSPTAAQPDNSQLQLYLESVQGKGQLLDRNTRSFMEQRFGYDFSQVQIHTDSEAAASAQNINAKAYTFGQNIVFGEGQYVPSTTEGQKLLAHELVHVVQQKGNNNPRLQRQTAAGKAPDNWDLRSQELVGTSYEEYIKTLASTTFLGREVKQVHSELAEMLEKAQQILIDKLRAENPDIQSPIQAIEALRKKYTISVSSTLRQKQALHGWGLAIDFDAMTNPYILNEAEDSPEPNKELSQAYDEIAKFMLDQPSSINLLKKGRNAFGNSVSQAYEKLKLESDAMQRYFEMMDDSTKLEEFIRAYWWTLNPVDEPTVPSPEQIQKKMEQVREEMRKNYMILGGKDEQGKPMPVPPKISREGKEISGGDRPFAPKSTKGIGEPKKGFLNIPQELVLALTDAGLAWGALDLEGEQGDIQHFDTRLGKFGKQAVVVNQKYKNQKK